MHIPDPHRGEGVQISQELKLILISAILVQLRRDLVQPAQQVDALGEIPPRRVPEVVEGALPFEDGAEEVELRQGCVLVQGDGLEACECQGGEDGRGWVVLSDGGDVFGDCGVSVDWTPGGSPQGRLTDVVVRQPRIHGISDVLAWLIAL